MQLVLMSLKVGETIPCETHDEVGAQFVRVESGTGRLTVNDKVYKLQNGVSVMIPNGTKHCFENTDKKKELKLYSIYTPPEHAVDRRDVRQPKTMPKTVVKTATASKKRNSIVGIAKTTKKHRMTLRK